MPLDTNPPPQYVTVTPDGAGVARTDVAPADAAFWTDADGDPLSVRDAWLEKTIDGAGVETLYGIDAPNARPAWFGLNLTRLADGPDGETRYAVNCRFDSAAVSASIHYVVLGHTVTDGLHDVTAPFWIRTASYVAPPELPALDPVAFLFDGSTSPAADGEQQLPNQINNGLEFQASDTDGGSPQGVVSNAFNGHKAIVYRGADFGNGYFVTTQGPVNAGYSNQTGYLLVAVIATQGDYSSQHSLQVGPSGSGYQNINFMPGGGVRVESGASQGTHPFVLGEPVLIEIVSPGDGTFEAWADGVKQGTFPGIGLSDGMRADGRFTASTKYGFIYSARAVPSLSDRTKMREYVADKFGIALDA